MREGDSKQKCQTPKNTIYSDLYTRVFRGVTFIMSTLIFVYRILFDRWYTMLFRKHLNLYHS
ncbi:hypothetical protein J2S19_000139 [Metabacillus malikii]|uniref:Uncharacterized protein n=1 Tax=Metabacillus malikii TaxID=1504265 RepID=A0ABT9ZAB7_9BACI|nr:hypothetical protein [Metabacillus malikii]